MLFAFFFTGRFLGRIPDSSTGMALGSRHLTARDCILLLPPGKIRKQYLDWLDTLLFPERSILEYSTRAHSFSDVIRCPIDGAWLAGMGMTSTPGLDQSWKWRLEMRLTSLPSFY